MAFYKCPVFVCAILFLVPITNAYANDVDADTLATGKALFQGGATPACAICHTLRDAESTGTIGPNLDDMTLTVERVKKTLVEGTGVMPSFAESLSEHEIEALAQYVVSASASH